MSRLKPALVRPPLVTVIGPLEVAGTTTKMWPALQQPRKQGDAVAPPGNVTMSDGVPKPVPKMSSPVPVPAGSTVGETLVITGTADASAGMPIRAANRT